MSTEPASACARSAVGLPRRFLRALLLLVLDRDQKSHGYELYESVRRCGLLVDMAGVYRDLRAMDRHDLVRSDWEPSDSGPERRVYELTDGGRRAADEAADEMAGIRDGLATALEVLRVTAGVGPSSCPSP